jgi:hypothetical protein
VIGAGGAFIAEGALLFLATPVGALCGSSLELQLEIPNAASNESTRMVKAIRAGVHNGFSVLFFFFACISYLLPITSLTEAYHSKHCDVT